jgi:hypothetical protein
MQQQQQQTRGKAGAARRGMPGSSGKPAWHPPGQGGQLLHKCLQHLAQLKGGQLQALQNRGEWQIALQATSAWAGARADWRVDRWMGGQ